MQYEHYYLPGGIEYRKSGTGNNRIEAIYHAEGRYANIDVDVDDTPTWQKEYTLKDHLGNARITFTDKNGNGMVDIPADIVQENHYYPFGYNHEGNWRMNDAARDSRYQYNKKELHDDFGLNWYAYGFRWYDPAIGRFTSVDPIADKFPYVSSYNYAENEPVAHIDLHGLQKVKPGVDRPFVWDITPDSEWWDKEITPTLAERLYLLGKHLSFAQPSGRLSKVIKVADDIANQSDDIARSKSIWETPSIKERGLAIEKLLGGNLPDNFPVIDKFDNGIATSIKSVDLTAKSYQSGSNLTKLLNGYVDNVANFNGRTWAGVSINSNQIKGRALEVAVQTGKATKEQWKSIQESINYALKKNVNLSIKFIN